MQSQIRPAPHFNTLASPFLSYGAYLAAFLQFTNGHSPIILNHLWEAHYPDDLAETLMSLGISSCLCSPSHPAFIKRTKRLAEGLSLSMADSPVNLPPPSSTIIKFHYEDQQDEINVCLFFCNSSQYITIRPYREHFWFDANMLLKVSWEPEKQEEAESSTS